MPPCPQRLYHEEGTLAGQMYDAPRCGEGPKPSHHSAVRALRCILCGEVRRQGQIAPGAQLALNTVSYTHLTLPTILRV